MQYVEETTMRRNKQILSIEFARGTRTGIDEDYYWGRDRAAKLIVILTHGQYYLLYNLLKRRGKDHELGTFRN